MSALMAIDNFYSCFQIYELHHHNQNLLGTLHATSLLWSTNMKTAVSKNCTDSNRRKKTVENHNSFYQDNWINQYRLYRTAHYSLGTLYQFYKAAYNSNK